MTRHYTTLGLVGYLFIGTGAILVPAIMPFITAEFAGIGLSLAAIGVLFPVREAGGIVGNLLAGIGSDVIGRQRLVWVAALLLALALALTAMVKIWLLFIIGLSLVSATQGALSTGINAMIADANRTARARALNTLHGVYGVGAAISPLIIGYLIEQGLPWRWALGGTGCIWMVYGLIAYFIYRVEIPNTESKPLQKLDLGMLRQRPFLALFIIGFIYNGVAVSLLGWVAIGLQRSAGFSLLASVSMISVFYVALTIGRFLCALYAERIGYATILLILACGATLTYPLVVASQPGLIVAGVFCMGLSFSGLFPTVLAYGARLYPHQTGSISGTLSVALTIGSMIPPLWTGVIADMWSFQVALGVNYVMLLPLIFLARYLGRVEGSLTLAR